jgi:hypothetical protein
VGLAETSQDYLHAPKKSRAQPWLAASNVARKELILVESERETAPGLLFFNSLMFRFLTKTITAPSSVLHGYTNKQEFRIFKAAFSPNFREKVGA